MPAPKNTNCEHRGEELRRVGCQTCRGNVQIKVFSCSVHGECTIGKPIDEVKCCVGCGDAKEPKRKKLPSGVAVIITSHNYGRYLGEAIDSALGQSLPAAEIVVVDDSSDDDTFAVAQWYGEKVRYIRGEWRNTLEARRAGFDATESPIVCFLDADDVLPPDYLARGFPEFNNSQVGIVWSDLERFGTNQKPEWRSMNPTRSIHQQNWIHAGSLVRRVALDASGVFDRQVPQTAHADWRMWRSVLDCGWLAVKSPALYRYRQHGKSQTDEMIATAKGNRQGDYFQTADLAGETITLAVPFSGRSHYLPRMLDFLELQEWPHRQTKLLLLDSSHDPEFTRTLRSWLATCSYPDVRILPIDAGAPGIADDVRREGNHAYLGVQRAMPRIYQRVQAACETEYLWIVEDDVMPPIDAAERLMRCFGPDVASVGAAVPSRFISAWIAWDKRGASYLRESAGVQDVGGTGFGCTIIRRSVLASQVIHHGGHGNYDQTLAADIGHAGYRMRLNWDVRCVHGELTEPVVALAARRQTPIHTPTRPTATPAITQTSGGSRTPTIGSSEADSQSSAGRAASGTI